MKKIISLFLLFIFILAKGKRRKDKEDTPKGNKLANHWGYPAESSPYGPSDEYNIIHYAHNEDGQVEVTSKNINSEFLPIPGDGNPKDSCELVYPIENRFCREIKNCEVCAMNSYCAWCHFSQLCLPGKIDSANCTTNCYENQWIYHEDKCQADKIFGEPKNMALDATKLITPEIVLPPPQLEYIKKKEVIRKKKHSLGNHIERTKMLTYHADGHVTSGTLPDIQSRFYTTLEPGIEKSIYYFNSNDKKNK